MPLYDYRCTECEREVEVMHGIHEGGPETCETCGGPMRKALSAPAIHFRGSGWAKKDAATATAKKAEPKATASTTSSSDDKGDSKAKSSSGGENKTGTGSSGSEGKASPTTSASADTGSKAG